MFNYTEVSWDKNAPAIYIGPKFGANQLYLPDCTITARVLYSEPRRMNGAFKFRYRDERLILISSSVESLDGELETKDLTELKIPLIKSIVVNKINEELIRRLRDPYKARKMEDESLAQLYWASHLSNNEGRKTIASLTGWARSTTNYHLNRLAEKGLLPTKRGH